MEKHNFYQKTVPKFLFILDILLIILSYNIVYKLRFGEFHGEYLLTYDFSLIIFFEILVIYIFNAYKVYEFDLNLNLPNRFFLSQIIFIIFFFLILFIFFRYETGIFGRIIFFFGISAYSLIGYLIRILIYKLALRKEKKIPILYLAGNFGTEKFYEELINNNTNLRIKYLFPFGKKYQPKIAIKKSDYILSQSKEINNIIKKEWSAIILGSKLNLEKDTLELLMEKRLKGIKVFKLHDFFELIWHKIPIFSLKEGWFIFSKGFYLIHNLIELRFKYFFDKIIAFIFLLLSIPLCIITALLIKIESKGKVFYKQIRSGLNEKKFTLYKFRSMYENAEKDGIKWAKKNDSRITKVGKLLRKARIDEIPQLINVLKGDMSFVGPRPERPELNKILKEKIHFYDIRNVVKPGITGWAQIMYPYGSSIEDAEKKLEYDLYYIKNYSIFLDLEIILKTVRTVLFGKGL
ncbi:MAG: sugar transferase [Spirochaetia bacterium]|nr:sugar transferase [Spirochaetia bacterium]